MQCSTAEHKPGCICNDCLDPPISGMSLKAGAINRWDGMRIHDVVTCPCLLCQDARAQWAAERAITEECAADQSPDNVNHPPHYTAGGVECIDAIKAALTEEEFRGFCKGNALKYVWRERHKGGTESLAKATWYLNWINQ